MQSDLFTQGYGTDHLRKRMCITPTQYGCALVAYKRTIRRIKPAYLNFAAGVLAGAAGGVWLALELAR